MNIWFKTYQVFKNMRMKINPCEWKERLHACIIHLHTNSLSYVKRLKRLKRHAVLVLSVVLTGYSRGINLQIYTESDSTHLEKIDGWWILHRYIPPPVKKLGRGIRPLPESAAFICGSCCINDDTVLHLCTLKRIRTRGAEEDETRHLPSSRRRAQG